MTADTLSDFENRGVWRNVIEKYAESAHFIYELLQNADDANATHVDIRLDKKGFYFKHNGNIHFTVTNPDTAEKDSKAGKYGHLDAITAIGSSSKPASSSEDDFKNNKIGKFGIGFKSVFQYTASPEVYDDNLCFRLEDYIVPVLIEKDHPWRKQGETLFYLPFNKQKPGAKVAYQEIEEKLKNLDNPILFLHNLREISWSTDTGSSEGMYTKECSETYKHGDMVGEHILVNNLSSKTPDELWLFHRVIKLDGEGKFPISVGYYIKDGKTIDTAKRPRIFCFFSTQVSFDFCFIMHAPFLLAENRENIRESEDINTTLFDKLSDLSADALLCLKEIGLKKKVKLVDKNIFDIVPLEQKYGHSKQSTWYNYFYTTFKSILANKEIHLSTSGEYVDAEHALKADNTLCKLLSEEQVSNFISLGSDMIWIDYGRYNYKQVQPEYHFKYVYPNLALRRSESLQDYFKTIGITTFYWPDFGKKYTTKFMEGQSEDWLYSFYKYLNSNDGKKLLAPEEDESSAGILRRKAIVQDENGKFVPVIGDDDAPIVYISDGTRLPNLTYVKSSLLTNANVAEILAYLGVSTPDATDIIDDSILPKYEVEDFKFTWAEYKSDFLTIFKVFKKNAHEHFVAHIKSKLWFRSTREYLISPCGTLYASDSLIAGIASKNEDIHVLDREYYHSLVSAKDRDLVDKFLDYLKLPSLLKISKFERDYKEILSQDEIQNIQGNRKVGRLNEKYQYVESYELFETTTYDFHLDTFATCVKKNKLSKDYSLLVWKSLLSEMKENSYRFEQEYSHATIWHRPWGDGRYNRRGVYRDSALVKEMRDTAWLYGKDGKRHKPCDIYVEDIDEQYLPDDDLFTFIGLNHSPQSQDMEYIKENCSETTQEDVAMGQLMRKYGIKGTEEDIAEFAEFKKEKERREYEAQQEEERKRKRAEEKARIESLRKESDIDDLPLYNQSKYSADELFDTPTHNQPATSPKKDRGVEPTLSDEEVETLRRRSKEYADLVAIAEDDSKKYTYEWFNALLELEFRASGESTSNNRGIHIVFSKVERDPNSDKGILLRNPSRYIPRSIEECNNIEVLFYLPDNVHPSITFEVASVQDYVLRLKCKNEDLESVENLLSVADKIYRAEIKTDTPIKLISELQSSFKALDYEDDFSLLDNIDPTIKFVFGPPGTGKTTHLVKSWINKVASRPRAKMLVLCPTNKAADVIAQRALTTLDSRSHPEDWLFRFVATADDSLTEHVCSRDSEVYLQDKCCVISTIARFSYDGFAGMKLKDIEWDYILIDEASMIPLAEIIYPLYQSQTAQFIIAGDPFQIEPIVNERIWADENIYKMINLADFSNPHTVPVDFDITNLPIQYRAVPAIGKLYSDYAYNKGVSSDRKQESQRKLTLKGYDAKSVNFVLFPVNTRNPIYEPQNVMGSNIHIYSALFTYEFVKYLAKNIDLQPDDKPWRIGIISPYRAQAELINKLWEQRTELYGKVDVQIGTVHGFQGDECDIILAVYNPPAKGMKRNAGDTFVNKKNILNVAISRAQDYLFLIMPDKEYENYNKLEAKTIGVIAKENPNEMKHCNTQDLEKIMFNDTHHLDKNTFVTAHQLANVYSEPSTKYEVRFDEKSVDIQVK